MILKQLKYPTFTKHERREQRKIKLQAVQYLIDNIQTRLWQKFEILKSVTKQDLAHVIRLVNPDILW
jgi:hypothetical protein